VSNTNQGDVFKDLLEEARQGFKAELYLSNGRTIRIPNGVTVTEEEDLDTFSAVFGFYRGSLARQWLTFTHNKITYRIDRTQIVYMRTFEGTE